MTQLGSSSKPTTFQEGFALNAVNQMAQALTLPSGGPWRVYRLGGWLGGWSMAANYRLVLWSAGGSVLEQTGTNSVASQGGIALGQTVNAEIDISDVILAGGTTVYVGWWRNPSDNVQNGYTGSGSHVHDTAGSAPQALGGFSSHGGGIGSYLFYDASNRAPTAPTWVEPDQNDVLGDQTPTFDWTHNDPDGDPQDRFQLMVDANEVFGAGSIVDTTQTTATTQWTIATSLARNEIWYARVRTRDADGLWSPWSAVRKFRIAAKPSCTITKPDADGIAAPLVYGAGDGGSPKLRVTWDFDCLDGGSQDSAIVRIKDSAGSSTLHTHNVSGGSKAETISGFTPTNGTIYNITVQVTCSHNVQGDQTSDTARSVRARWARGLYRADLGAAPLTLSSVASLTANGGQVIVEYASSAAATPEPTSFKASVAAVTKRQYIWHRVTLLPEAVAVPTSPALNSLTLTYSNNVLTPDKWTLEAGFGIDEGTFVYGTQSLKYTGDGAGVRLARQTTLEVTENTEYVLSLRAFIEGNPGATFKLRDPATLVDYFSVTLPTVNTPWARYVSPVWNSEGATSVEVVVSCNGAVDANAWFDAVKLEASTVVTPWTPGFLGKAVVLDAGGLSVDKQTGGIFRMRGSAGGARDLVELGDHGLWFGGTGVELWSSVANRLNLDAEFSAESIIASEVDNRTTGNGAGTNYPMGLSWFEITSSTDAGWPDADGRGMVVTFRAGDNVIGQLWFKRGSVATSKMSHRAWNNATVSWRPWITLGP